MEQKVRAFTFNGPGNDSAGHSRRVANTIASTAVYPHEGIPIVIVLTLTLSGVTDSLLESVLLLATGLDDLRAQAKALKRAEELSYSESISDLTEMASQECLAWLRECGDTPAIVPEAKARPAMPVKLPPKIANSSPAYPTGLSAREVEVLRLVAQGMTDAQVAQQLVISPRTVNWHLTSIYSKIGVSSRSAATRYAIEQRLA